MANVGVHSFSISTMAILWLCGSCMNRILSHLQRRYCWATLQVTTFVIPKIFYAHRDYYTIDHDSGAILSIIFSKHMLGKKV